MVIRNLQTNSHTSLLTSIKAIRDQLNEYPKYDPRVNANLTPMMLNKFEPMSAEDIMSIIKSMVSKSRELDVVPTTLLKDILPHIIDTLIKSINASLKLGIFTEEWKVAIERPLFKKLGLELMLKKYRPVSNLLFLSKVLEKCALKQLDDHCKKYASLPDCQSAYRHSYSCKTAFIKLMNDLL